MKEIIALKPYLKDVVWGGTRLRDDYGYQGATDHTGECWGISAHPNGMGYVASGAYAGASLMELYRDHRELFGGISAQTFPLLTKIIDAAADLSIQVHPDDEYARTHEHVPYGKTECWYVVAAAPGSTLIIGHNAQTREELAQRIRGNDFDGLFREVPVRPGDFVQINPGTVHAIKGGLTILETQQSSDITYRVYDYHRLVDGHERPLHIEPSIEVITVPAPEAELTHTGSMLENVLHELINSRYYRVWKLDVNRKARFPMQLPFMLGSVVDGVGAVDDIVVSKGSHFIIPSGYGNVTVTGEMELILSSPK